MNIMSLDAAYGDGTMQELHRANADSDYGHGQGDEGAQALQQVPRKPDGITGFSQLPPQPNNATTPPGRNVVAQFPQPPPPGPARPQQPPPPLPVMPQRAMAPMHPQVQQMQHMQQMQHGMRQQMPVRDDERFQRIQKKGGKMQAGAGVPPLYDANGVEIKEKKSFYENYKVLIIVFIVVICLVLGILVAVVVAQKKKAKLTELTGGGFDGAGVPQYVGGMDFGNHFSSLPQRAWNESASVYVRR